MEEEAFAHLQLMHHAQTLLCRKMLFQLFDLVLVDVPDGLVVKQEGKKFLCIN